MKEKKWLLSKYLPNNNLTNVIHIIHHHKTGLLCVEYYYNVKLLFSILIYFKMKCIPVMVKLDSVFSVMQSFRNDSNMLIWCSSKIYCNNQCWKQLSYLIFFVETLILFQDSLMKKKKILYFFLYNCL